MPAISTAGSPAMTKLPDACRLRLLVGVRMGAGREIGSAARRGGAGWRTARIRPFGRRPGGGEGSGEGRGSAGWVPGRTRKRPHARDPAVAPGPGADREGAARTG